MKLKTLSLSLLFVAAVGILSVFSVVEAKKGEIKTGPADPNMVVIAKGTAVPVSEPRKPGALCAKLPLKDAVTDRTIGNMVECFENFTFAETGAFSVERTTYLQFPQGELVTEGLTMSAPIIFGGSPGYSHAIASIPAENEKNISSGTGRFQGVTGRVRLSGAVNVADPDPSNHFFNCIFVIDLD